ncbi:MAG: Crp/Fnr family transcriptional regulator [Ahrensia sp.]|nr:Crp/Fnr family transcriptional regulator [Ahrensia sp.]
MLSVKMIYLQTFILSSEGRLTARSFGIDGKEVVFGNFVKGQCFSRLGHLENSLTAVDFEAQEDSLILKLSGENFDLFAQQYPNVIRSVIHFQNIVIKCLAQQVFEFSTMSVPKRVRACLLRLARGLDEVDNTVLIDPAPSHYEIATSISTHREAVSRELGSLASAGIIKTGNRSIKILDMKKLISMIEN